MTTVQGGGATLFGGLVNEPVGEERSRGNPLANPKLVSAPILRQGGLTFASTVERKREPAVPTGPQLSEATAVPVSLVNSPLIAPGVKREHLTQGEWTPHIERYRQLGWVIIPLEGKAPIKGFYDWQKPENAAETFARTMQEQNAGRLRNIGFATGAKPLSGLTVLDIDLLDGLLKRTLHNVFRNTVEKGGSAVDAVDAMRYCLREFKSETLCHKVLDKNGKLLAVVRDGMTAFIKLIDEHNGGRLPDTAIQISGGGGIHLMLEYDQDIPRNMQAVNSDSCDIRSGGGYVAGVGSISPDFGTPYIFMPGHEPWNVGIKKWSDFPWLKDAVLKSRRAQDARDPRGKSAAEREVLLKNVGSEATNHEDSDVAIARRTVPKALIAEMIDLLDPARSDHRPDWISVLFALKHELGDDGEDLAHKFSALSAKYEPKETEYIYRTIQDGPIGVGTLRYMMTADCSADRTGKKKRCKEINRILWGIRHGRIDKDGNPIVRDWYDLTQYASSTPFTSRKEAELTLLKHLKDCVHVVVKGAGHVRHKHIRVSEDGKHWTLKKVAVEQSKFFSVAKLFAVYFDPDPLPPEGAAAAAAALPTDAKGCAWVLKGGPRKNQVCGRDVVKGAAYCKDCKKSATKEVVVVRSSSENEKLESTTLEQIIRKYIRDLSYRDEVFLPEAPTLPDQPRAWKTVSFDRVNLFNGWNATPIEGKGQAALDLATIEAHELLVCGSLEAYRYWECDMADWVQHPWVKRHRSPFHIGPKRCGKTIEYEFIAQKVVGMEHSYCAESAGVLTKQFNGLLECNIFVYCEEFNCRTREQIEATKQKITAASHTTEHKGLEAAVTANLAFYAFLSDKEDQPVIEDKDLRFALYESSNKHCVDSEGKPRVDTAYFDRLKEAMNQDAANAWLYKMLKKDLTGWDRNALPYSKLKEAIMAKNADSVIRFMDDLDFNGLAKIANGNVQFTRGALLLKWLDPQVTVADNFRFAFSIDELYQYYRIWYRNRELKMADIRSQDLFVNVLAAQRGTYEVEGRWAWLVKPRPKMELLEKISGLPLETPAWLRGITPDQASMTTVDLSTRLDGRESARLYRYIGELEARLTAADVRVAPALVFTNLG